MNQEKVHAFLERTNHFHQVVDSHIVGLTPADGTRYSIAFQAALLSLEHASACVVLIRSGLFPSAFALMRTQYESLVRGIWLLHAASEMWVDKLSEPLTLENAKRANEGLGLADMLKQLEISPNSPKSIVEQLKDYKDASWKAMNSYTHGGLHPLSRMITGYPVQLTFDVIRNSNAIVALAGQLASILTGDPRKMGPLRSIHADFADCLPILSPNP
ncbi:DUF6988 family protein [Massilia sp. GCM10020059]|uniref:AbiV family abortive infection protein n=1 Tax=Massilia agrisoli TaxID=2892444 RepID=A0ABS8IV59_9BURK|nr:hypothetical protein [Massilia agrisoli]MCC6071748.1 hypothetical protein [Massilia agrisoli]